jgi:hypothetical protein
MNYGALNKRQAVEGMLSRAGPRLETRLENCSPLLRLLPVQQDVVSGKNE